jgi:hypothetical protein
MNNFLHDYALFVFGHPFGLHLLPALAVLIITVTVATCMFGVRLYSFGPSIAMKCLGLVWLLGSFVLEVLALNTLT